MSEEHNEQEHVAKLIMAMEKHVAFLEGALGIEMSPWFKREDIACHLLFPSRTSQSEWMDDSLLFNPTTLTLGTFSAKIESVVYTSV